MLESAPSGTGEASGAVSSAEPRAVGAAEGWIAPESVLASSAPGPPSAETPATAAVIHDGASASGTASFDGPEGTGAGGGGGEAAAGAEPLPPRAAA